MESSKSLYNNEKKLANAITNGNEEAFKYIYDVYYAPLCLYANKYLYDIAVSEDIVQDCIFTLWEMRSNLTHVLNIKSYLYKTIHNKCLNYIQHQKVKGKYENETVYSLKLIELEQKDSLINKELGNIIAEAIEELPSKCKICFCMKRIDGLSQKSIAQKLEISEKAVEANISRALNLLRKKLNNYLIYVSLISLLFYSINIIF